MKFHTDKVSTSMNKVANHTIRLLCTAGVTIFVTVLPNGCVKDELYKTSHPDKGAIQITTDWSGLSVDAVRPESYQFRIGGTTQVVSAPENTFKELLPEGTYSLLVHNLPRGITVGTQTAIVNTLADGTLEPMPEFLFSAMQELNVIKDDTLRVTVPMVQTRRKLTLILKLKPGDAERIVSSQASLTGIAHTVDLRTGKPVAGQTGKTVTPSFAKATVLSLRTTNINALTATLQLVGGVAGEQQLLRIVVTLTDDVTATVESDLTEALKNFSENNIPLTINAELPLPDEKIEGTFNGTITGWTEVDNDNITIH